MTDNLATNLLKDEDLISKIETIYYFQKIEPVFFDTTVIFKAEILEQFIDVMHIDVDKNLLLTACLVYSFKKIDSPQEIERLKSEKDKDIQYLKSLGFDDKFCKICREHTRYGEEPGYIREPEGDILEIVDQFGGMLSHREERLALPVDEALDLLENRNLKGKNNRYLETFKEFIKMLEEVQV